MKMLLIVVAIGLTLIGRSQQGEFDVINDALTKERKEVEHKSVTFWVLEKLFESNLQLFPILRSDQVQSASQTFDKYKSESVAPSVTSGVFHNTTVDQLKVYINSLSTVLDNQIVTEISNNLTAEAPFNNMFATFRDQRLGIALLMFQSTKIRSTAPRTGAFLLALGSFNFKQEITGIDLTACPSAKILCKSVKFRTSAGHLSDSESANIFNHMSHILAEEYKIHGLPYVQLYARMADLYKPFLPDIFKKSIWENLKTTIVE